MLVCLGHTAGARRTFFFCFALKAALISKYIRYCLSVVFTASCHLQPETPPSLGGLWLKLQSFLSGTVLVLSSLRLMSNVFAATDTGSIPYLPLLTCYYTRAPALKMNVSLAAMEGHTRCNSQSLGGGYLRRYLHWVQSSPPGCGFECHQTHTPSATASCGQTVTNVGGYLMYPFLNHQRVLSGFLLLLYSGYL